MDGTCLSFDHKTGDLTSNTADGAIQSANTGVIAKRPDDCGPKVGIDSQGSGVQTSIADRFGEEIILGNLDLLGVGITGHHDRFETVHDSGGDIAGVVSGGDE